MNPVSLFQSTGEPLRPLEDCSPRFSMHSFRSFTFLFNPCQSHPHWHCGLGGRTSFSCKALPLLPPAVVSSASPASSTSASVVHPALFAVFSSSPSSTSPHWSSAETPIPGYPLVTLYTLLVGATYLNLLYTVLPHIYRPKVLVGIGVH